MTSIECGFYNAPQTINTDSADLLRKLDLKQYYDYLFTCDAESLLQTKNFAATLKSGFTDIVIIATGASYNIPKLVFDIKQPTINIHFITSSSSEEISAVLSKVSAKTTAFVTITKSGNTIEIFAALSVCINWFKSKITHTNECIDKNFFFLVGSNSSLIRNLAVQNNATIIDLPQTSGRFSFFSTLGVLVCTLSGLEPDIVFKHAKNCFTKIQNQDSTFERNIQFCIAAAKKYTSQVVLSYSDKLCGFNLFIRQMVAESLGKNAKGINPYIGVGTIEHHSQMQLYLDGPDDKFFTILVPPASCASFTDYDKITHPEYGTLNANDIFIYQINSAIELLKNKGKTVRVIKIQNFDEVFLAEIMVIILLEVIAISKTFGLNPFDQPAVEDLKVLTKSKILQSKNQILQHES